jgi:hypothetical protein
MARRHLPRPRTPTINNLASSAVCARV